MSGLRSFAPEYLVRRTLFTWEQLRKPRASGMVGLFVSRHRRTTASITLSREAEQTMNIPEQPEILAQRAPHTPAPAVTGHPHPHAQPKFR